MRVYQLKWIPFDFFLAVPEYDLGVFYTSEREEHQRPKRALTSDALHEEKLYKLNAFEEEVPIQLSLNRKLMSPDLKVEVMRSDGSMEHHPIPRNTFYLGKLANDPDSMVAVSDDGGLVRKSWSRDHFCRSRFT